MRWEGCDIDDTNRNCLMSLSRMEDFIWISTSHAAVCGKQLVLIKRDTSNGAMIEQVWKCPSCTMELSLTKCGMIKSSDVAQGKGFSRSQPDFNLRLVKGIPLTGINTTKIIEFMSGEMGVKIAHVNNLRGQITKVRKSIRATYGDRVVENRKEHVAAVRQAPAYCGDVHW